MHVDQTLQELSTVMERFHVIFIEGMGGYDHRDPNRVAEQVVQQLRNHWIGNPPVMPLLVMTQGDPPRKKGISAITPLVAEHFGVSRGMVCLDEEFDSSHSRNADRENVMLEFKYSQILELLNHFQLGLHLQIEKAIDEELEKKNLRRAYLGKKPTHDYFRTFALLQEVTKAACKLACNGISVIHTSSRIHEFSVSSFYRVGLQIGTVSPQDMVSYVDLRIATDGTF